MKHHLDTPFVITVLLTLVAFGGEARAADPVEEASLLSSVPAGLGLFGTAVDIDGDTAVVGAFQEGPPSDSGAAYVFERGPAGWNVVARLTASNAAVDDELGQAVAISGETVVVGAPSADAPGVVGAGAAYVFVRPAGGWKDMTETARLTSTSANLGHTLGNAVDIDGETIVVGDVYDKFAGFLSGAAYVYVRPSGGWVDMTETGRLTPSNGQGYDRFAHSVSISGDTILVGSHYDHSPTTSTTGTAFVFQRPASGWTGMNETQWLVPPALASNDFFGISVSISGDTLIVGAYGDDDVNPGYDLCKSGAAYVYVRSGGAWTQQAKLVASGAACLRYFGWAVAVDGDRAVVGAPGNNGNEAIVFERMGTSWSEVAQLASVYRQDFDRFAEAVAIDGDRIVVGAARNSNQGYHSPGAAFVFAPGVDWTDLGQGLAGTYGVPTLKGEGTLGPNSTTVARLANALQNSMSIWVVGASAANSPLLGGTLVPNPDVVVFVPTSPLGEVTAAATWPPGVPTGAQMWLQTWVVDAAAVQGASATNALMVTAP